MSNNLMVSFVVTNEVDKIVGIFDTAIEALEWAALVEGWEVERLFDEPLRKRIYR